MPYKPTGRPPGRPSTKPKPAPPKPEAKAPEVKAPEPGPVPESPAVSRPAPYAICRECYPDGWPQGATGLGCQHGIWSRPWIP